ncbi:hypothetical protein [Vibrio maerlii]|uniref:hypothetical protein n=1 Tax=Vibrio maerlii TaxID=2231648 RepID=UPI000E3CFFEB|nr:hypothetical protein [Vibrio maerlii]
MYKFVKHPLDATYTPSVPPERVLTSEEVPPEELEMREVISCWYEEAFDLYEKLTQIEIENKEELLEVQTNVLEHHNKIILLLLKRYEYRAALQRMLSVWTLSDSAKVALEELIELSNETRKGNIVYSS